MNVQVKRTLKIREATLDDIEMIVQACAETIPELPHYKGIKFEPDHLRFTLETNLGTEGMINAWVLVDDAGKMWGGSAGYCVKLLFSRALTTGDLYLFVNPLYRTLTNVIGLIDAYKKWAISRGAVLIDVTHTSGYRAEAMDKLLQRLEFEPLGMMYRLRRD